MKKVELWMGENAQYVGTLVFQAEGRREVCTLGYATSWLESGFALSPDLPLVEGFFHFSRKPTESSGLPYALLDAEPDGWGRRVIMRLARKEGAAPPRTSLDFLLGVDDTTRIGALRFRVDRKFVRAPSGRSAPPLLDLDKVAGLLRAVETGQGTAGELAFLSGLGTSLGGVRPKCSFRDRDGSLLIGKFSSATDERNVVRGEMLAMRLAMAAGLNVSETKICHAGKTTALAVRRFDRSPNGRIPYLSAGSMLGLGRHDDFSYLQMADHLRMIGSDAAKDRRECWRRMAFNFLICNIDDHARNHGFLHVGQGKWRLAPAFDLNPFPDKERVLKAHLLDNVSLVDNLEDIFAAAPHFGLRETEAQSDLATMSRVLLEWKSVARSVDVGMSDQDVRDVERAFDLDLLNRALALARSPAPFHPSARRRSGL